MSRPRRAERRRDLGQKLVAHHLVAELDGGGETFGIGPAVAFDDDAVEPEKYPAIGSPRVKRLSQLPEARARKQIADPGA